MDPERRYPAGRPPHDAINGLRIGGLAGGIIGLAASAIVASASFWVMIIGAVIGAGVGYFIGRPRIE